MAQQQQPFVDSASMAPKRSHEDWPPISDFNSGPQSVPEPPVRLEKGPSGLVKRIALFVTFAATVALLIIFAKPLSQVATGLFEADRKSTRLNSSHLGISYAVFCLKK